MTWLSFRGVLFPAALVLCGMLAFRAQAGERSRGRSIEFSNPKSDEVTTNLHQLGSKRDSLKQLEEDLYKPLQSFSPKSSMDGVMAAPEPRPVQSPVQTKRAKELLDKRNNWMFLTPEEMFGTPTARDILNLPEYGDDGQDKRDMSPMQKYYDKLGRKHNGRDSDPLGTGDLFDKRSSRDAKEGLKNKDGSDKASGVEDSEQGLKKLLDNNPAANPFAPAPTTSGGMLSDIFGLNVKPPTLEETLAHKARMEEFQQIIGGSSVQPSSAIDSFNPLGGLSGPTFQNVNPLDGLGSFSKQQPPQPSGIGSLSGALPDLASKSAVSLPSLATPLPKPEPAKPLLTPPPSFNAPRRQF